MKKNFLLLTFVTLFLCACSVQRSTPSSSTTPSPSSESSVVPEPSSSITPEPSSSSEKPEPISSSSEKPEPISSSSEKPEPISSSSEKPEPISSSSEKPEPISSSTLPPAPSSSSIKPTPSSSSSLPHEHIPEDKWTYDSTNHWHECIAHDGAKIDIGAHDYDSGVVITEPTYTTKGSKKYTCKVCTYSYTTDIPALGYEACCDDMNAELKNKTFFDVFEIKEYLITKGYNPELNFETTKFFGYDLVKSKVVIYTVNDGIIYPNDCKAEAKDYVSFQVKNVTTLEELTSSVLQISTGCNYSTIKLTADITLTDKRVGLNSSKPLELDLNKHEIKSSTHKGDVIAVSNDKAIAVIKNGTVSSYVCDTRDFSIHPACVSIEKAKTVRVTNCALNSRAQRGYGIIDGLDSDETKIKVNDNTINAKIVGIATQKASYLIDNCGIDGTVAINGGNVNITNCTITSKFFFDDEQTHSFVTNEVACENIMAYLGTKNLTYDKWIYTSTDAVIVLDRRSAFSTYTLGKVSITGTTMNAYSEGSTVYGYGFRYLDLNNDPLQDTNNYSNIKLTSNTYPKCSSTGTASGQVGGYSRYDRP